MGCDIHTIAEKKSLIGKWEYVDYTPFNWRNYDIFALLGGVRNGCGIPEQDWHYRGLPINSQYLNTEEDNYGRKVTLLSLIESDPNYHSFSWILLDELLEFDYTANINEYSPDTYLDILSDCYFTELIRLKSMGVDRIIYWFDN